MKLTTTFRGADAPFEGDRTVTLRSLPADAAVSKATITLTPVAPPGGALFEETITFQNGRGSWGATRLSGETGDTYFVEVDFHARRTMGVAVGPTNEGANLQVDLGGMYVEINSRGAVVRGDSDDDLYELAQSGVLPSLAVNKFKLTRPLTESEPSLSRVLFRASPTNVSLRLGAMPPFWTRLGEMTGPETSPDFAEVLQAFLAEAEVENGRAVIPLVIHSDAPARLDVTVNIEYAVAQNVLPDDLPEVQMPFDHSTTSDTALEVTLPVGARVLPGQTTARVIGAFDASRIVFGPTGAVTAAATVPVTPAHTQAQPLLLAENTPATAVDLLLTAVTRTASLTLNIIADGDGKPFGDPLLSQPAAVALDRELAGSATWISVPLPAEFQFLAGERYWLVLQSLAGEALWSADPAAAGDAGLQVTVDGGLSYRQTAAADIAGPLAAFFRLRYTPASYQVPIELQVGQGPEAVRVSLDRFQPLGRIDFALDFAAVAEAFNAYLADAGPPVCPSGEHLANPDFESWYRLGDAIGQADSREMDITPHLIAIAPGGDWAYLLAGAADGAELAVMNVGCQQIEARFGVPGVDQPNALLINPDGRHAYILSDSHRLTVVDAAAHQVIGAVELSLETQAIAISPDGRLLYAAGFSDSEATGWLATIRIFDAAGLADAAGNGSAPDEAAAPILLSTTAEVQPGALAVSADGTRLYVAMHDDTTAGQLRTYDAASGSQLGASITLGDHPVDLAVSPDGRWAVVAIQGSGLAGRVELVDLAGGGTTSLPMPLPLAVAVSPDSRRAFAVGITAVDVSDREAGLQIIDLAARSVEQTIELSFAPTDTAVTPQGDLVLAPGQVVRTGTIAEFPRVGQLAAIPIGYRAPAEWELTAGAVMLRCLPAPYHLVALLGEEPTTPGAIRSPSGLSQVLPASGGCPYTFSFWGLAEFKGAKAELLWRGDGCDAVRTDEIAITPIERPQAQEVTAPTSAIRRAVVPANQFELVRHDLQVTAPAGATQVEVRFSTPSGGRALLDAVSLQATEEAIGNGDFGRLVDGQLADWALEPDGLPGVFLALAETGVELRNLGLETAALVQTIEVTGGETLELAFSGESVEGAAAESPQVEIVWQADGAAVGAPTDVAVSLPIMPGDAGQQTLTAVAPEAATAALVQLVVPPGATLLAERVQLRPVATVTVPVSFIAQSPGALTLSDVRVAYEMAPPPPPALNGGALCAATLPSQRGGVGDDCCCYCPCCSSERRLVERTAVVTAAGRPAELGRCVNCGTPLIRHGGTVAARAARLSSRNLPSRRIAASRTARLVRTRVPIGLFGTEVVLLPPLTAVSGIAEARAGQLNAIGIATIADLAEAAPDDVAALRGVSPKMARSFIHAARRIVNKP